LVLTISLPFFFLAMYEKNGQPLEVILIHIIETVFIRPKIRPYVTDNYYSALIRQAEAEREVERIVRLSGKEKKHRKEVCNAGGIKPGRKKGGNGNLKEKQER